MTARHETAYREIKTSYSDKELERYFQPTGDEIQFVSRNARKPLTKLALLVHIKVLSNIGKFCMLNEVPVSVIRYIMRFQSKGNFNAEKFLKFDKASSRSRLLTNARKYTNTKPYDTNAAQVAESTATETSKVKDKIPDIINVVIEELVRQRYELPGFSTLVRIANTKRKQVNQLYYDELCGQINFEMTMKFDRLLLTEESDHFHSDWNKLKTEPGKPTNKVLTNFIDHFKWLRSWTNKLPDINFIPVSKRRQFMLEARALNAGNLKRVKPEKRYSLIVILFYSQLFNATDNLINLFIKKIGKLHANGLDRLHKFQIEQMERTDKLIKQFRDVLNAYQSSDDEVEQLNNITSSFKESPSKLLTECEEHIAYSDSNYYPFLLAPYAQLRSLLFNTLSLLKFQSTTNDETIMNALSFVLTNQKNRKEFYDQNEFENNVGISSLHWMPKKWKKVTLVNTGPGVISIKRKYFELCLFSQISNELKSADLIVNESSEYSDLELQLIGWDEYENQVDGFCDMLGYSSDPEVFSSKLKETLDSVSLRVDHEYHENKGFYLDEKGLHIRKPRKSIDPQHLAEIEDLLRNKIKNRSVLDIITDVEAWTDLHKKFGPLSGFKGKIKDQRLRFITTLFCYGFNLGPTQTAQSINGLTRKQVAWSNQRHITEEGLDGAIFDVINLFNRFTLPNFWGDGKSASADGTKWSVYEQNLLSEYHIRYGGYGGIGYYHVSDKYIALFSHFIPCGVYEAVYILDGLIKNKSEIRPDVIHGDTQAQSLTVFGLSHLLGIELMPRIRDLKSLIFYRSDKNTRYQNIDQLFQESIDWNLIKRHLPDMLRVALSIKAGKVEPSAILRRLGSGSRKNRLYFAFRELGRVIRTIFLLKYISDIDLRKTINAETNKSEQFNDYLKWLFFGNRGVIPENLRHKQTKIIKYSHLVANMVILYNVEHMTRALNELKKEGVYMDEEILSKLNPFRKSTTNRYGSYSLKMKRNRERLSYDVQLL